MNLIMKKLIYFAACAAILAFPACDADFLEEKPLDFMSTTNALVTYDDYTLSINEIYRWIRSDFYIRDENRPFDYIYSTDIVFDGQPNTQLRSEERRVGQEGVRK